MRSRVCSPTATTRPAPSPASVAATDELAQYLYAEVIDRLTVDVFGFMLATSVLDVLEPAACDEITGRSDSRALLADLARRNVLTESIDGGPRTGTTDCSRLPALRSSAAHVPSAGARCTAPRRRTSNARNDEDRALRHWIDAGEVEEAWVRFRRRALPRFWDGAVTSVAQWTAILPKPSDAIDITRALDMALTLILHRRRRRRARLAASRRGRDRRSATPITTRSGAARYIELPHRLRAAAISSEAARQATNARQLLAATAWSWDELRAPFGHAQLQTLLGRPGRARTTIAEYVAAVQPGAQARRDRASGRALGSRVDGRAAERGRGGRAPGDRSRGRADGPGLLVRSAAALCPRRGAHRAQPARRSARRARARDPRSGRSKDSSTPTLLPLLALARVQHLSGDGDLRTDVTRERSPRCSGGGPRSRCSNASRRPRPRSRSPTTTSTARACSSKSCTTRAAHRVAARLAARDRSLRGGARDVVACREHECS